MAKKLKKKVFWCLELVPVGLLVELVRVLDQYRRAGQGLNTSKLEFFSGSLFSFIDQPPVGLLAQYW